jgi:membrane fusion protein, multidrug efflux system
MERGPCSICRSRLRLPAALLSAAALAACGSRSAAPPAPAPIDVGVVTIVPAPVTLTRELPGRTSPFRVAEVRARVNGIVLKRLFAEGSDVREGQKLFVIDPAPYAAALDGASATLSRAEATLGNARVQAKRAAELIKTAVISQQDHDNAMAALKTAEADVAQAKAAEETARINLGYTTVTAPVSGRIGRAVVTEGAYVQAAQATLLATVQQIDPMFVDLTQSADEVLRMRRDLESGKLQGAGKGQARVRLVTDDGKEYAQAGTLQFADVTVDPGTGSILLRALFPNPKGDLLPGMFVRARLDEARIPQALLVPQVAVTRDQKGLPVALVVNAERKVERRPIVADRTVGSAWLVTDGIRAGDQVIVEGVQKVRPGVVVNPVPASSPGAAASVPPAPGPPAPSGPAGAATR